MARASLAQAADGQRVLFHCPGCDDNHQIGVGTWTFNGDLERPTFTPSVLVRAIQWDVETYPRETFKRRAERHAGVPAGEHTVCHSFVTDGRIQFLGDCTHELAGQIVDLPEWPHAS